MSGTAYAKISTALGPLAPYTAFCLGEIDGPTYQKWIENEGFQAVLSLNEDQLNLSARFPRDKHDFVRRALSQCRAMDLIADDRYDMAVANDSLADIDAKYDHGQHLTYIFPEENALMYALVQNIRPRRAACLGSYYGYWALAAKAACPDMEMTLMDIDTAVMGLARSNFSQFGLADGTRFLVGPAEKLALSELKDIDLLILDAEGPKELPEGADLDFRDKAIYYPHLKAAFEQLAAGAVVVAHNVILSNFTGGVYFEGKASSYREQYSKFLAFLRQRFWYTIIDSTEGTLIARKL